MTEKSHKKLSAWKKEKLSSLSIKLYIPGRFKEFSPPFFDKSFIVENVHFSMDTTYRVLDRGHKIFQYFKLYTEQIGDY